MSDYMTRNASALRSYDAMLARGDRWDDPPYYQAPVALDGLLLPPGISMEEVRRDLSSVLHTIDHLELVDEMRSRGWVDVEGTLEEVQAGEEEAAKMVLYGELKAMGYEPDGITVKSYEETMDID